MFWDDLVRRWRRESGVVDQRLLREAGGHVAVLPSLRPQRRSRLPLLLVILLAAAALVLVVWGQVSLGSGGAPAASCAAGDWPATAITCDTVFRMGDQAGARVDRSRIWLTTLGAVKSAMHPAEQVSEPADSAEVWVVVYDGRWLCCPNAFDENGNLIPQVDQSRWLVVAEAAQEGTGFIYIRDWTGKPVPDSLPPPKSGS